MPQRKGRENRKGREDQTGEDPSHFKSGLAIRHTRPITPIVSISRVCPL